MFEVKNGNSKYTQNQINANVYDKSRIANTPNSNTLDLSKGKTVKANIATKNQKKINDMEDNYNRVTNTQISFSTGTSHTITFHTVWYHL